MQNKNKITVLILAAGYGKRMGPFSRMVNKSLIPYNNKPLISHIIEKFDTNTKFVIACGHLGNQVKDYVGNVHNDKEIVFVDIDDYNEVNTGPATTIQKCSEHIKGGFLWLACDTLFDFNYRNYCDENWIGVYPVDSIISQDYCWVEREAEKIVNVVNKKPNKRAVDAFIGLMYVKDDEYLNNLLSCNAKDTFEGFKNLNLSAYTVHDWKDFGTYEKWYDYNKEFSDVSFPKPNELFYCDNGKIIKYFTQESSVNLRLKRAQNNLNCMPTNIKAAGNFLIHDFTKGDIIYNQYTLDLFKEMLVWCEKYLWIPATDSDSNNIKEACHNFYYQKTIERLNQFRVKYSDWSESQTVNDRNVKSIDEYVDLIDWNWLSDTVEWRFIHGDLHFDNTIYDPNTKKFTAIDWRTDFSGRMHGDLYYDVAKMLGGLWLNYREIKQENYEYQLNNENVVIKVPSIDNVEDYQLLLQEWVISKGLDWKKVSVLVPIIYLNMSPLHDAPFDKFLIALAQYHFSKIYDV